MNESTLKLEFTERMAGHFVAKKFTLNPSRPLSHDVFKSEAERADLQPFEFTLTISISDLERFVEDPQLLAQAEGHITDFRFRQNMTVEKGCFQLFTRPAASPHYDTAKEMHYTLYLTDREGKKWTFFGFKELMKEETLKIWEQTTTLYYYIWEGHSNFENFGEKAVHGVGTLRISLADFIKQLRSFKTNAVSLKGEQEALGKFLKTFAGNLWEAYAPYVFTTTSARWNEHVIPLHTTEGVALGEKTLHPLNTRDGINITVQRFKYQECKDVVLLVHGLTTSTDMFIMPEHENLVNHLHSQGFTDVFSLDWRGSSRFTYNLSPHLYSIDDVAKYDIPRAVEFIREQYSPQVRIHVVAHCVGSIAFMASYAAGYISNIASLVSNSVSLTPKVKWQALMKMMVGPEILESGFGYTYISPKTGYMPGKGFGKWLYWMERTLRNECTEPACHLVSFMWGWGFPAVYNHRNIHPVTHRRLVDLFGGTSFNYYKHIRKMLLAKASVSWNGKVNYLEEMMKRDMPPTLFISGADNNIFPGSNKMTYEILRQGKNAHKIQYQEFAQYGHQDVFMGQFSHSEVFPKLMEFLKQNASVATTRKLRVA
ncbi:alpha/beta fold hydrolase [Bdellovibrio sp. 22V]|uniref:alpha/beta fold hydrolase n=1 Tax=Bdellovibrio TaxID=958 RepID=UPI002542DB88|nr:alpha/beta fold hydrolase [Bdellovibrio sp. 22V]WII73526.1 alpha/beta fold hydrolase [Bdellovibrio sp. 22V]